jgi:prepilin-type N-terminal cleavage/methylation domain-containing protein
MTSRKNPGFTMLELTITIAIVLAMAGVTFVALTPLLNQSHVAAAYDTTLSAISGYRNQATTSTERYILTFTTPGTITVQYWAGGVPVSPAPVTVATYTLPSDIQFAVQTGVPNPGPDGFSGTAAVTFNACTITSGQPCLILMPDGSAQDDIGNYNGGVVYLSRPGDLYSSRAISVIGPTGKIRGWNLSNQGGSVWVQQ